MPPEAAFGRRSALSMSGPGRAAHIVNIDRCSSADWTFGEPFGARGLYPTSRKSGFGRWPGPAKAACSSTSNNNQTSRRWCVSKQPSRCSDHNVLVRELLPNQDDSSTCRSWRQTGRHLCATCWQQLGTRPKLAGPGEWPATLPFQLRSVRQPSQPTGRVVGTVHSHRL